MNKTFLFLLLALTVRSSIAQTTAIVGAYGEEITLLLEKVQDKKESVIANLHFTEGILNGRKVVVALTGIGKVNAAIATTLMIEHFHPAELLFSGIAGGIDPALSPGDLVIGTKIAYHDYGILTDTLRLDSTRNPATTKGNPLYFPSDAALISIAQRIGPGLPLEKPIEGKPLPRIVSGTIVTGDVFVSSRMVARRLWQNMQAEATDMEGAAVAQTCWQQGVPFLVIRCLSDAADGEAEKDIARFYRAAAHNAAMLVAAIAGELAHRR